MVETRRHARSCTRQRCFRTKSHGNTPPPNPPIPLISGKAGPLSKMLASYSRLFSPLVSPIFLCSPRPSSRGLIAESYAARRSIPTTACLRNHLKTVTPSASSGRALSEAKGRIGQNKRFLAEFILEQSEGLGMTFLGFGIVSKAVRPAIGRSC